MKKLFLAAGLCAVLAGCATQTTLPTAEIERAARTEDAETAGVRTLPVVLPDPAARPGLLLAQRIHAEVLTDDADGVHAARDQIRDQARDAALGGRRTADFEAYLTSGPEGFRMALMHAGLTVWTLGLEAGTLTENRRPGLPPQLKGEYLLRDIAYAYWPRGWLSDRLAPLGFGVAEDLRSSAGPVRRIARLACGTDERGAADQADRTATAGAGDPTMFTIRYEAGASPDSPDGRITIENAAEGYRLIIESQTVR